MSNAVVAGVDVGNATTEVVLVDRASSTPLAWDRAPTRGRKGSERAAEGAASLLRRVARRAGIDVDSVVLAPQRPVDTSVALLPRRVGPTGRLRLLAPGAATPGAAGVGAGRPVVLDDGPAPDGPVVVLVRAGAGYDATARRLRRWLDGSARAAGRCDVRAVLLADDEGVLVARRAGLAPGGPPVLDRVDVDAAREALLLAVEVCPPGTPSAHLADPLRLVALLGLGDADRADAVTVAHEVADAPSAVVALLAGPAPVVPAAPAPAPPAPGQHPFAGEAMDDVWQVDLDDLATSVEFPRAPGHRFGTVLAGLVSRPPAPAATLERVVAEALGVPVTTTGSEAAAARAGALTTPGVRAGAVVLDLGGGTLDAVAGGQARATVAGGGELVGAAVAALLGLPRGAAEWVKRGPCSRLESPQLVLGEDGLRTFLDRPGAAVATGSLVVPGPAGWLPFSRDLAPAQWRAARLALKREALGRNVSRVLELLVASLDMALPPAEVVLVGGVAGDGELLRSLAVAVDAVLPGALVGRACVGQGRVAGDPLGHRWAVAYGLTLLRE